MKQIAPQINELCEEVMSQSKTPRTDTVYRAECGSVKDVLAAMLDHARTLELELTRLSAEKAELDRERLMWKSRYDYVRALNVPQFQYLYQRCMSDDLKFDDQVDAARQAEPQENKP